ncbi:hypothetical protein K170097C1_65120 [Hungatella effluvii]
MMRKWQRKNYRRMWAARADSIRSGCFLANQARTETTGYDWNDRLWIENNNPVEEGCI